MRYGIGIWHGVGVALLCFRVVVWWSAGEGGETHFFPVTHDAAHYCPVKDFRAFHDFNSLGRFALIGV